MTGDREYAGKRELLVREIASLYEFFSYNRSEVVDRIVKIAEKISPFDSFGVVIERPNESVDLILSGDLDLPPRTGGYTLSDFQPVSGDSYIVDRVEKNTAIPIAPVGGPVCSYILIPLITRSKVLGIFFLGSRRERAFDPEDLDLFFSLGTHLAVVFEIIRNFELFQEEKRAIEALRQSQIALASSGDLSRVVEIITAEAVKTLDLRHAAVYLSAGATSEMTLRGYSCEAGEPKVKRIHEATLESPPLSVAVRGKEPLWVAPEDGVWTGLFPMKSGGSGILVPISLPGEVPGLFVLHTRRARDDSLDSLIRLFTAQAGAVLGNALLIDNLTGKTKDLEHSRRLIQEYSDGLKRANITLEKRLDDLTTLFDVGKVLNSTLDIETILHFILDRAIYSVAAEKGVILMKEGDLLRARVWRGIEAGENLVFPIGKGIAGQVARSGRPRIVEDVAKDPNFIIVEGGIERDETLMAVPIFIEGEVIGVINVDRALSEGPFSPDNLELLSAMAELTANAINKASLFDDLKSFLNETLEAFAQAVDTKDPYTAGHSKRVRDLATAIAARLNLGGEERNVISRAALLHDVGKIGISNAILLKPGKLSEKEYSIMKSHTIYGENILKQMKRMQEESRFVRHHHEWWNGTGYPDGLKGGEIPLGASIIGVADAFDTMTSDRPYRRAMSREDALEEVKRWSGIQFDPLVVGSFLSVIEEIPVYRSRAERSNKTG